MDLDDYPFRLAPLEHQIADLRRCLDMPSFAHFHEQGTGKTKILIDTACVLYRRRKISAVIVVAPSSVDHNWVSDELPKHIPESILPECTIHLYQASRASTKWHQRAVENLVKARGLSWLVISYDAIITKNGKAALWKLMQARTFLYALDESARIKTPGAARTKVAIKSGKYAAYRRIMSGTPVDKPFDIYSQIRFLSPDFWVRHGMRNFAAFKARHAEFITRQRSQDNREFQQLIGYRNLDGLREMISPLVSRVRKDDVLDLPPKLFSKRYFELTSEQKRLYRDLRDRLVTELDGDEITVDLAITKILRLQQITCGYLPASDEDEPVHRLPENPRLDALLDVLEDITHQVIIWSRFRLDVSAIMERVGSRAVRFDGEVGQEDRNRARQAFIAGDAQIFCASIATGCEGLTLVGAKTTIYYSCSASLIQRLQSEDRNHRIGQDQSVEYVDLVAAGTVDVKLTECLQKKLDLASQLLGDPARNWM